MNIKTRVKEGMGIYLNLIMIVFIVEYVLFSGGDHDN
jgi:hypothetical protein